jgi:hypothetical protein
MDPKCTAGQLQTSRIDLDTRIKDQQNLLSKREGVLQRLL